MQREQIKALALANGFKLKTQPDGSEDLNPYVYEFAAALQAEVIEQMLSNMFHQKGMTASHYKCAELVKWMQDYANQIRQQAKEQKQ